MTDKISPFRTATILECVWSNLPDDVDDDVTKLWEEQELGNDTHYFGYDEDFASENEEQYPALIAYIRSHDIKQCLIHYWW